MNSGNSSTYDYNSDGLRVSRTSNSVTTDYVWDVNRSIPVILQDGTNTYVYGRGLISATDSSGDQTYRLIDGLGSTVGLCDGSGNMIGTYAYDAFGIIRAQTGSSDNDFLFTGEQRDDESGYDYLRARYYDSEVGRFLGQDAASPDWRTPVTINRFTYALNSPLVLVDPNGLFPICHEYAGSCLPGTISDSTDFGAADVDGACYAADGGVLCNLYNGDILWAVDPVHEAVGVCAIPGGGPVCSNNGIGYTIEYDTPAISSSAWAENGDYYAPTLTIASSVCDHRMDYGHCYVRNILGIGGGPIGNALNYMKGLFSCTDWGQVLGGFGQALTTKAGEESEGDNWDWGDEILADKAYDHASPQFWGGFKSKC